MPPNCPHPQFPVAIMTNIQRELAQQDSSQMDDKILGCQRHKRLSQDIIQKNEKEGSKTAKELQNMTSTVQHQERDFSKQVITQVTAPNKKEIVSLIKQTTRTDIFPSQNSNKEQHPVSKAVGPPDIWLHHSQVIEN